MNKELQELKNQIKALQDKINNFYCNEEELKKNDWFCEKWDVSGSSIHDIRGYVNKYYNRKATQEEIKTELLRQAKEKGFVNGVSFQHPRPNSCFDNSVAKVYGIFYANDIIETGNYLYSNGKYIYTDKEGWATIIKEAPKLTFGGEVVDISEDGKCITCKKVKGSYEQLKSIHSIFSCRYFGSVEFKGYKIANGIEIDYTTNSDRPDRKVKIGCVWGTTAEIIEILTECEKRQGITVLSRICKK